MLEATERAFHNCYPIFRIVSTGAKSKKGNPGWEIRMMSAAMERIAARPTAEKLAMPTIRGLNAARATGARKRTEGEHNAYIRLLSAG